MKKAKTPISKARSYAEIGEFWDEHDLNDYWGKTKKVQFEAVLEPEATYYAVSKKLSDKIELEARKHGVRSGALVERWLEQKIREKPPLRRAGRLSAKNP